MRSLLSEFKKFILRGNVVDLAVGIVIGTAFGKIVDSMVKDVFMPLIGLATGGFDVSKKAVNLSGEASLAWGAFLQAVINFVIIGFCMFIICVQASGATPLYCSARRVCRSVKACMLRSRWLPMKPCIACP